MRRISPIEGLPLFFLIGLILLTLIFRAQIPFYLSLLIRYVVLLALLFLFKWSSAPTFLGKAGQFFYSFSPLFFIVCVYESLGDLIQHLRSDIDPSLIQIDFFIFGVHPTVWMEKWIVPWLTDMMSFAYISYYFLPLILIVTLYRQGRMEEFNRSVFILVFGYYISFIGYIFFPAIGPRYTLTDLQSVPLEGSFLTDFVRDGLNAIEHNKRDCMPSGHTQIALMVLFLAHRHQRFLFYVLFPIICGLILSTIYLRYHYVIDLFVGATLAVGCMIIAPRLHRWWNKQ